MQSTRTATEARTAGLAIRLGMGALGGVAAGVVFIALTSWFASTQGEAPLAPFKMISTIVLGPPPAEGIIWLGMLVHVVLSLLFGLVFAALTHGWAGDESIALAGLVYGGAIYAINFQVLSRFVDYWSAFLQGTNQPFEVATHLVFGAVLALFLIPVARHVTARHVTARHASE